MSLAKDEPDTNLVALMKEEGVRLLREAMGIYISTLKTGIPWVVMNAFRRQFSSCQMPVKGLDSAFFGEGVKIGGGGLISS